MLSLVLPFALLHSEVNSVAGSPLPQVPEAFQASWKSVAPDPREKHFKNIRQLTFGGQNAEAYWSPDGSQIVFQSLQTGYPDEQIFIMSADGRNKRLISTGKGRCTCSYFSPDGKSIFFSSTHERNEGAQAPIDMSLGYVWMVNPDFALYKTDVSTTGNPKPKCLIKRDAYVAETTISLDGKYMVWTSDMEGDLEIYRSDLNGGNIKRLTNKVGYDGGPFVSWDGSKIAYRRQPETTPEKVADYKNLLAKHLVRPSRLDIWVMDADGSNKKQVTNVPGANFAPFIHPDGKRLVFSSNHEDPKGREFDIYMVNLDGTNMERITYTGDFDGFPMFSKDGKKLLFASNRNGKVRGETNVFVADWID